MKYYSINKNIDLHKVEIHIDGGGLVVWHLTRDEIKDLIDAHINQSKQGIFAWYSNQDYEAELREDGMVKNMFNVEKKSITLSKIISITAELYVDELDETDKTSLEPYN